MSWIFEKSIDSLIAEILVKFRKKSFRIRTLGNEMKTSIFLLMSERRRTLQSPNPNSHFKSLWQIYKLHWFQKSHSVHLSLPSIDLPPHQFQRQLTEQTGQSESPLSTCLRAVMGQRQTERSSWGIQIRDGEPNSKE